MNAHPQQHPSRAVALGSLADLLPTGWKSAVAGWLAEDAPSLDYGGYVVGRGIRSANVWAKESCVLAGTAFFNHVFALCSDDGGCEVDWLANEGDYIRVDSGGRRLVAVVAGPARSLLLAERTALNLLARSSGIATQTRNVLEALRAGGYRGALAGTRKTTPGFRLVEKYAMLVGGADTHRMDLSSMVMLKDNHIGSRGGNIADAVAAARAVGGFSIKVEVEVSSPAQADEAVAAGADVVMLDNFSSADVRATAHELKRRWAGRRYFLIEASGGVTRANIMGYACDHVDVISTSSIHQGVRHIDFSMKIADDKFPGF